MMPQILESELEDFLSEGNNLQLVGCDIESHEKLFRQLTIGGYGRADLCVIGIETTQAGHYISIKVVELKRDKIGTDTLLQAAKYVRGLEKYFEKKSVIGIHFDSQIFLVGSEVDLSNGFIYLADKVSGLSIRTYSVSLESGIEFEEIVPANFEILKETFDSLGDSFLEKLKDKREPKRLSRFESVDEPAITEAEIVNG